jgi:hypothetical protein
VCTSWRDWGLEAVHNIGYLGTRAALFVVGFAGVVLPVVTVAAAPGVRSDGRSAYTAVAPCRLLDTRDPSSPRSTVDAATIRIQVTGRCGVGVSTSSVAVSLTVTNSLSDGYAVVTPAATRGPTSTINWARGETRAASTVVAVSPTGALDVRVSTDLDAVDLVVDVTGAWAMVTDPVRGGRLVSIPGRRVLDTRSADRPVAAGQSIILDRTTLGIPDSAVAVAGTLTTSGADGPGFLTAYPDGAPPPVASNVNNDHAGQDRAAGIIVALGSVGLSIYAGAATTDVIVDVTGYITGDGDSASTEGLLIAVPPRRVLDTRDTIDPITTAAAADVGEPFTTAQVNGIIATVTASDGAAPGHASFGSAQDEPTSALNWPGGAAAVAAMTIQRVPSSHRLSVTSSAPAALIVDVTGYLLAAHAPLGPEILRPGATSLTAGTIDDSTGVGRTNGDPITLLTEVYSANVLAAGGAVSIVTSEIPGGGAALVPFEPHSSPACGPQPRCILLSAVYWDSPDRGGTDANRVMISHEWAHVLSMRYQAWLDGATFAEWQPLHDAVNEECLADAVAALALQRAGLPGNETPTYIVHYMCDEYWTGLYGPDAVTGMRTTASTLAADLLAWAEGWGAAHHV